jgi:hypothetical protein
MLRGANAVVGITWYSYFRNPISTTWVEVPGSGEYSLNREWSPVHLELTSPSSCYYASIQVGMEGDYAGQSAGSVWFDDISFTSR